jgi:hypothetical protein
MKAAESLARYLIKADGIERTSFWSAPAERSGDGALVLTHQMIGPRLVLVLCLCSVRKGQSAAALRLSPHSKTSPKFEARSITRQRLGVRRRSLRSRRFRRSDPRAEWFNATARTE